MSELFETYGHVYQHPRYKKDTKSYEWNLNAILDSTFEFLFMQRETCWIWVSGKDSTLLAYIAGLVDAEGHISMAEDKGNTSLNVNVYNTNRELVVFVGKSLAHLGYKPIGPYLDKEAGTITSKYGIERKKDYWRISLARFAQCQSLLRRLPLRHEERIQRKDRALSLSFREPWQTVQERIRKIQTSMRAERDKFVQLA